MKVLVAYYSKTNNTKRVAEDVANQLGADLEVLVDKKKRTGFFGYLFGGRDGMIKKGTQIEEPVKDPEQYDLVILGSPVWAWNIAPALRTYLEAKKEKIGKYAFFVTSGNTPSEKIAKHMKDAMGSEPLAHIGFDAKQLKEEDVYNQRISSFVDSVISLDNSDGAE